MTEPSRNPADSSGDMPGAIRQILHKFLQGVDDALPAKVIAFDRAKNRAIVQPMIAMLKTDGGTMSRHQVQVPVFTIGGGGCVMSFNLVPGDLGWIKATDRDMAEFLKSYSESAPATGRTHDFDTAVFFPDVMTGYTVDAEDEANAVLQTLDGAVKISLFPGELKITAPLIEIVGPTTIQGSLDVSGGASLGAGGEAIARVGDQVKIGSETGLIITGSLNHTAT